MRQTKDGRVALLAYTALDRLVRCMGPHQPWVLYETARLHELETVRSYDVIYLDMEMPRELWRTSKEGDEDG
nr:SAV_915 family protein [Actinomyces bowdenii]